MLKLKDLTIKNFLSVGNVTQAMKLDDAGLTLILGLNTDSNGGTTRNGAGKSTILQAISYVLFGKPLTKIKIGNLVNNINQKAMLVTLELERDGVNYRIERGKKPDVMEFYVDDVKQKFAEETVSSDAMGENRQTQVEIDRLLGMSHTMFKHIVALNTFTDPFLKMGAADQRGIIEELLGITQISSRADTLKKLILLTKENIRDQQASIKATDEANQRIDAAIRSAEQRSRSWSLAHDQRVTSLASDLEATMSIDFDAELSLFDSLDAYRNKERDLRDRLNAVTRESALLDREYKAHSTDVARFTREAEQGVEAEVARFIADQGRKVSYQKRHQDVIDKKTAEIVQVRLDITNANGSECVCCGQSITGTAHLETVLESLADRIVDLEAAIRHEEAEIAGLATEIAAIDTEIATLREREADRVSALLAQRDAKQLETEAVADRITQHAASAREATEALAALGHAPETIFASRDEVYKTRQTRDNLERDLAAETSLSNPHASEIANLTAALQPIDYVPVNEYTELLKHQDFLLKLLSNKDSFIRKKIIDQNLSYLNSRLNFYLDKLGLPHEVRFQSDLTVDITNLGRDFDFEQLSRGEMNRVIMATSWSFRDMWESTNAGCNLLWVDELLDQGTDTQGVEAALSILKSMARDRGKNVFLISHRDELQARIDRTLLVRKENGFTQLEIDGVA